MFSWGYIINFCGEIIREKLESTEKKFDVGTRKILMAYRVPNWWKFWLHCHHFVLLNFYACTPWKLFHKEKKNITICWKCSKSNNEKNVLFISLLLEIIKCSTKKKREMPGRCLWKSSLFPLQLILQGVSISCRRFSARFQGKPSKGTRKGRYNAFLSTFFPTTFPMKVFVGINSVREYVIFFLSITKSPFYLFLWRCERKKRLLIEVTSAHKVDTFLTKWWRYPFLFIKKGIVKVSGKNLPMEITLNKLVVDLLRFLFQYWMEKGLEKV